VTSINRRKNGVKVTVENETSFFADAAVIAMPLGERRYYRNEDQEKEKLRNIFPLIALLEQNPDTYKDTTEFRPCGGSSSNRGGRSDTNRYVGRSSSTHYSSSESGGVYEKPAYKRENRGEVLIHLQPHQLLNLHHVLQNRIRQLTS
ncbi:polyamine oxidase 2, partial [Tanacetum coccineum]